jgi:hypothetical protein
MSRTKYKSPCCIPLSFPLSHSPSHSLSFAHSPSPFYFSISPI